MDPATPAISAFWAWFGQSNAALRALPNADHPFWDTALAQLKRVHKGLAFEMSDVTKATREFIITAQGDAALFPLVDAMVASAPARRGWAFVALKPAMGFDFVTDYEGVKFNPKKMWFLPLEAEGRPNDLGLRIAIPGLRELDFDAADFAARVILETGLGERAASKEVKHIEVAALPPEPEKAGYIELTDLPAYIAWRKGRNARA